MRKISIICPMYNEEQAASGMVDTLKSFLSKNKQYNFEVIIINDGSQDNTVEVLRSAIEHDQNFIVISHRRNFGRGKALRTGFKVATGDLIITTEGDLSWGEKTLQKMIDILINKPEVDAVFASPHAPGGGYLNVPKHRIWLSKLGNKILQCLYSGKISMITGMTRGYRSFCVQNQLFFEDGKEIHLEIAQRLIGMGRRIDIVPATLSWPAQDKQRAQRTNWTKIFRLIRSHLAFGFFEGISRLLIFTLTILSIAVLVFGIWGIRNFFVGEVSAFLLIFSGVLCVITFTVASSLFILHHVMHLKFETWKIQNLILNKGHDPEEVDFTRVV